MKIVSACLFGVNCAWNGKSKLDPKILELMKKEQLIPVCPEQLGGLGTPRLPEEIREGSGQDVLDGKCRVSDKNLEMDGTDRFIRGAEETLKLAKLVGATGFIGKSKSPSCGCGRIYDGTFSDTLIDGDGVTAALLRRNGIKVVSNDDL